MKALTEMGFTQGVLPPQERPCIATLRALGFAGTDAEIILAAVKDAPQVYSSALSASSMWSANAATVSPSANTADGRVHFTAANLNNKFHRSIEHAQTSRALRAIFTDEKYFAHHTALPACPQFGDEGAANHTRFCSQYGERGVEFFVYGASGFDLALPRPMKFPARQTLEASQAIARLHGLNEKHIVFAQQNPHVIDAGVFHNDVIAVGNGNVLFCHELAFVDQSSVLEKIGAGLGSELITIEVSSAQVSIEDAVLSYLFNSQLLTRDDGNMLLLVPEECRSNERVWSYLQKLLEWNTPIHEVLVMDLRESMRNGGGPACLRLRVELTAQELAAVNPATLMNDALFAHLTAWVEKHYRDRLGENDLCDPSLLIECRTALDELTRILALGSIYPFQLTK
jgi:succinylarginine dihydrolase